MPTPDNSPAVPVVIDKIMEEGERRAAPKGFYYYTPEETRLWKETFTEFGYEITKLALKFPYHVAERKIKGAASTEL